MNGHVLAIALGNSLLWSVYLLLTRHVVSGAHLDAWAYTLVQLLSAGLAMLWAGRRTPGNWRDLLAPWTIGYAFMRVVINGCTAAAIVWLAVTQSTLLATMSVLIGAASGWALTRKAPARRDWPGLALLAVGIAAFAAALGVGHRLARHALADPVRSDGGRGVLDDRLPPAQSRDRSGGAQPLHRRDPGGGVARVHSRLVAGRAGRARWPRPGPAPATPSGASTCGSTRRWPALMFRAPGTWLGFWTINTTGVQTYLIALTAMPFFAIALEAAAARLGWLSPPGLSTAEWLAAAIILAGAVWLIAVRLKAPTGGAP